MAARQPVQERARRRREALLDAAARLLVRGGWEALTTRDLAAEAGVAIGTVYDYFGDREGVLVGLLGRYEERLWGAIEAALEGATDVDRAAAAAVDAFARVWFEEPGYAEAWLGARAPELLSRTGAEWSARFEPLLAAAVARFAPAVAPEQGRVIAMAAMHLVSGLLLAAATSPPERREALVGECRVALSAYLRARLTPGPNLSAQAPP